MTTLKAETLRALAEKATPGKLSTAERYTEHEHIECPACQGDGEVLATDYCNIDEKALGVQFYGIGSEFGAHEALWSYLVNAVPEILALLEADKDERVAALEAENVRLREIVSAVPISEMVGKCGWKNWGQARDGLTHALGKDQADG